MTGNVVAHWYWVGAVIATIVLCLVLSGMAAARGWREGRAYERRLWEDKHKHAKEILEAAVRKGSGSV